MRDAALHTDAVDLSTCAREPIHIPSAIQPHGALLVVGAASGRLSHASANLDGFLELTATMALGRSLQDILGEEVTAILTKLPAPERHLPDPACVVSGINGRSLQLRAYRAGASIGIDVELAPTAPSTGLTLAALRAVLDSFSDSSSQLALCQLAVQGLRAITGYDRVMAYRFGADGHGEVIAEALAEGLEPYLGQRYPASDIPPQARSLYLVQRVGAICDSGYQPVPVLADAALASAQPIDLTLSSLRSVSPIHREFMRNMGTAASLTIGLALRQAQAASTLWGMLVCHHAAPRGVDIELRNAAAIIGQTVSMLLDSRGAVEALAQRAMREAAVRKLVDSLDYDTALVDSLAAREHELRQLLDAAGVIVCVGGCARHLGHTPAPSGDAAVIAALRSAAAGEVLAIDNLGLRFPEIGAHLDGCAGALFMPLVEGSDDAIVWFRPEQAQTVVWGGNPAKPAIPDPATGRISPRASFAAWKEVVRGHSVPWSESDRAFAAELRRGLEAEMSRRTRLALDLHDRIFESAPTALVLVDRNGAIRMLNHRTEQLFGYPRVELIGTNLQALLPEALPGPNIGPSLLENAAGRTSTEHFELRALRRDGSRFYVEIGVNPVEAATIAGGGLLQVSMLDVSLRRDALARLEAVNATLHYTNKELEEFVYTASHDLRSPLRAISSLTRFILEDDQTLGALTLERMQLITDRAHRMQTMLDDVLVYARAGKGDYQGGAVVSAEAVIDDLEVSIDWPAGFKLERDPSLEGRRVRAVPLSQVLQNLVGNAIKHHDRPEGSIRIAVADETNHLRFTISDDGPGIPEDYSESVFQMFSTLKPRDAVEGTGMGLAIVRKIVRQLGGNCGLEPNKGRGTTVWFEWPQLDASGSTH
jgi:PAS domain S-box-containing protein